MSKKIIIIYSFVVIAVGIGTTLFINFNFANHSDVSASLSLNNSKEPESVEKTSDLGFEKSGKIMYVAKKIGDHVAEGEVLAKIDSADVLAQCNQARAGVLVAQGDLAALQNLLKKENLKLKSKGLSSNDKKIQKKQIASVENNIDSQRARVLQAQNYEKIANLQLDKTIIKAPFEGIISRQDIELGEVVNPNVSVITITSANGSNRK